MARAAPRAVLLAAALALMATGAGPRAAGQTGPAADPSEADRLAALGHPAETEAVLPEGTGRDETFGYCTACHNTAVIRRSGFARAQWDDLMDWMVERHGMAPLEGELRQTVVDYLARHFGPRGGRRGGNPFLAE